MPIVSLQFCGLELEPEGVVKGGGGQGEDKGRPRGVYTHQSVHAGSSSLCIYG